LHVKGPGYVTVFIQELQAEIDRRVTEILVRFADERKLEDLVRKVFVSSL